MSNTLLPCPFCGGEAELYGVPHIPKGWDFIPRCKTMSCCGRQAKKYSNRETAIAAWNHRANLGSCENEMIVRCENCKHYNRNRFACKACLEMKGGKTMIKDSGHRKQFESGAVRDARPGVGRCDLLPLGIIADRLNDRVFTFIEDYIRFGDPASLWLALDEFIGKDDKQWYSALLDVSKHYEAGCAKYGDRNWEKGIPVHCFIDSGVRHYLKWRRGDTDEPHAKAFIWNMLGAIWTHENKPELIDLPFKNKEENQ